MAGQPEVEDARNLKQDHCQRIVQILKALAHPIRLQIVARLCDREEHVSGLADALGVEQAIISQQLRILRMTGLVHVTRRDGFAVYALAEPHQRALIKHLEQYCTQL